MNPLKPDWAAMIKLLGRGPHTNDPDDPSYARHWDVVAGSLDAPTDDMIIGIYLPESGSRHVESWANVRFSGDLAYIDRAIPPEAFDSAVKPLVWAATHLTIQPMAIELSDLDIVEDDDGLQTVWIPLRDGGGAIVQRPNAISGRVRDAPIRRQIESGLGFLRRPRPTPRSRGRSAYDAPRLGDYDDVPRRERRERYDDAPRLGDYDDVPRRERRERYDDAPRLGDYDHSSDTSDGNRRESLSEEWRKTRDFFRDARRRK